MLRIRPKWPNAKECCGREVQTTRLWRKRAWWPRGSVLERFEQDMVPEIKSFLRNTDLGDAEIHLLLYMIGRNEEASRPTIMVCCADVPMGRRTKESLRESPIMRDNPEYGLGSIDHPLEQLIPAQGLASEMRSESRESGLGASSDSATRVRMFATSHHATIGRRLFVARHGVDDLTRYSTGGVVIMARGRFYQLTVGHISDFQDSPGVVSSIDPEACSIDGQSSTEGEDDYSAFQRNMHRASMSWIASRSRSLGSESPSSASDSTEWAQWGQPTSDDITTHSDGGHHISDGSPESPPLKEVGEIVLHSKEGQKPNLDYALVSIQVPREADTVNEISIGSGTASRNLRTHDITGVGCEERQVIVVTGSGGAIKGTLIPGTTLLGKANQDQPQKLYVIQLEGVIAGGDSGAAVVDETSGDLYGHVVSGCPGTRIVYMVAAAEVFADLTSRLNQSFSIASSRKLQKSWMEHPDRKRRTSKLPKHQDPHARTSGEPLQRINANSTPQLGQVHYGCGRGFRREDGGVSILRAWNPNFSNPTLLKHALWLDNRSETCFGEYDEEAAISHFMQNRQDLGMRSFESEDTAAIMKDVSLRSLRIYHQESYQRPVALVLDGSGDGGSLNARTNSSPLTAHQLFHEIVKMRSRLDSTGELLSQERSNIRRRLIYVTDLDSWSVAALIATARNGNAQELELACHIEKHLGWRSSLHASVSNLSFQLEFHLPFFAWRTSKAQIGDPRPGAGDRPLRKVRDLSFLRAESTDGPSTHDTDYLCEAQISCVLIGHHDRVWTAYCFVDTYFDLEDSKDSVNDYEDEEDFGEFYPDPLSRGTLDANRPILDPRIYFLRVLETRMLQVEQEWRDLTYLVKSKVNLSIAEGKGPFVLEAADGSEALAAHRSLERICQTIVLLRTLEQSLSDLVFQWQKFKDDDVTLFLDVGLEGERTLASLEDSFGELRVLERILHQLIQRCEDFMTVLNLRLTFDRTELREHHGKAVNAAQNTSTIVTVFFPPLLAAVVLSMPTSYFSSTIPTFAPFLVLTTLIFTAMLIVTIFRSSKCYRRILVSFSHFVKHHLESVPRETGFQSNTRGEPEPPVARGGIALNRRLGRQGNADVHGGHIELGRYP